MTDRPADAEVPDSQSLEWLPVVGQLLAFGPDDPVFDGLILAGPPLVVVLAVVGRTRVTTALAAGYVLAFVAYVGWRAATN